jgi:hypothetical protein
LVLTDASFVRTSIRSVVVHSTRKMDEQMTFNTSPIEDDGT